MISSLLTTLVVLWTVNLRPVAADDFTYLGCYPGSAFSETGNSFMYQSTGHCSLDCAGYKYYALTDGDRCLCSNSDPSGSSTDSGDCNTSCSGYPTDTCGGSNAWSVYKSGDDGTGSSSSSASSSSSSASSSSSSGSSGSATSASSGSGSSSSAGSSTPTATTSTSRVSSSSLATPSTIETTSLSVNTDNGKTITSAVVIKTTASYSDVYVTLTASGSGSTGTSGSRGPNNKGSEGGNGNNLSGGAIAGIVIGVVAAVAIFLSVLFFIWRQRKKARDLEKAQNAAIAATVVANTYSGKHPEKNRFSGLHDRYNDDDDEDGALGPIIGSTGDGNHVSSTNASTLADGFSRNPSSRYHANPANDGLGIKAVSPTYSPILQQQQPQPRNDGNEMDQVPGDLSRHSGDAAPSTPKGQKNGNGNGQDADDDDFVFSNPASGGVGLRIMNPDNESIKSGFTSLDPKNTATHIKMNSDVSRMEDSDDDLFQDRVRD